MRNGGWLLMTMLSVAPVAAQDVPKDTQIAQAVMAAPEDRRANAAVLGFVGGSLEFDLTEMLGGLASGDGTTDPILGALGDLTLEVVASEPMNRTDGSAPDGLYAVGLTLWE